MINRGLLNKSVWEGTTLFLACGLGLSLFAYFRVWVVSEIDSARFKQIIELLPKDWERFSSVDFQWLVSYMGRTAGTFSEMPIVMLICLWAIVRGSDVVSGELNRGTLEMILAQPVSRWNVYRSHSIVTLFGLLVLAVCVWLGMHAAVQFTSIKEFRYPELALPFTEFRIPLFHVKAVEEIVRMGDVINSFNFLPGVFNLFCLGAFLLGVTSVLSAIDRYRWRTLGLVTGLFIASTFLKFGSLATPKLSWMGWGSFLSLYEPELHVKLFCDSRRHFWDLLHQRALENGEYLIQLGPLGANLLLLGMGIVCWLLGGRLFHARDLPPPV